MIRLSGKTGGTGSVRPITQKYKTGVPQILALLYYKKFTNSTAQSHVYIILVNLKKHYKK
jgi:hypothetical protein